MRIIGNRRPEAAGFEIVRSSLISMVRWYDGTADNMTNGIITMLRCYAYIGFFFQTLVLF